MLFCKFERGFCLVTARYYESQVEQIDNWKKEHRRQYTFSIRDPHALYCLLL